MKSANGTNYTAAQMVRWIGELYEVLGEHEEDAFPCTCEPSYESDTNAWNHNDKCHINFRYGHYEFVLTEALRAFERMGDDEAQS